MVEETTDRLVLDLRYKYQDRLRDDEDTRVGIDDAQPSIGDVPGSRKVCWGFESRQFTLEKSGGKVNAVDMTGPVRGEGARIGNVTLRGSLAAGFGGTISR